MKLKATATILAAICGILPISHAFAQYPNSNTIVNFNEIYTIPQTESWKPSPTGNIFTVDGKKFILLDTDSEGNFFVVAEDHYGTYIYETGKPNRVELQRAETINGKTTFTNMGADMTDTESWRFNPTRKTNVAYWLNNDFVTEGNTKQYQFPKRVYNHILEKSWQVEGFNAFRGWTAAQNYDSYYGVNNAAEFANAYSGATYNITSKLAFMSYGEYLQYKDKIGVTFTNSGGWSGMMLRTCDAMVTASQSGNTRSISMTRSPLMVKTKNANSTDKGNLLIGYADATAAKNYYVRPCFWLSKDFFKEVPCELEWDKKGNSSIGAAPLAEIKKYSYSELRTVYTDGQLESLGYTTPKVYRKNYPFHLPEVVDLKAGECGSTGIAANYKSPAENLFSIDGKQFILLDKDKDGNYFVMTNEEYGQRIFSEYSTPNPKLWTEKDWYFDPENHKSIAYWLNNSFLATGNRFKGSNEIWRLPSAIQDSIILSDWDIEPHYPINGWTVASYATPATKQEIENWRDTQILSSKKRTVSCKVALMSFTEYQKYKDKIGMTALAEGYAGFSLRTPRSLTVSATDGNSWSATLGQLQVSNNISQNKLTFSTGSVTNDVYYVRPVFRLSKDFFAKNVVDIATLGENVKNEIAYSYDYYDLRGIYSDNVMRTIGVNPERKITTAVPAADKVTINGNAAVGMEMTAKYQYISNDDGSTAAAERGSKVTWYISDTKNGLKKSCSDSIFYTPTEADVGKYVSFGIIPKNAYGISSNKEYFSRTILVAPRESIIVEKIVFTNEYGDEIENLNGTNLLNIDIKFTSDSSCIVFAAAYDSNGKLMSMNSETTPIGINDKKITLANMIPAAGSYCKVIIFKSENLTKPIYSKTL